MEQSHGMSHKPADRRRRADEVIVFATGNDGKFREALGIFPRLERLTLDLPELQAPTIAEVIQKKLEHARSLLPEANLIVEDSGIVAPQWGRGLLPGPYTKHFLENFSLDALAELIGVGSTARAVAVFGYIGRDGKMFFGTGEILGTFVAPRGDKGFGWDPIFQPDGHTRTFAEMTQDEKVSMSMRSLALADLQAQFARE